MGHYVIPKIISAGEHWLCGFREVGQVTVNTKPVIYGRVGLTDLEQRAHNTKALRWFFSNPDLEVDLLD
jgi:hypothetical protein